VWLNWREVRKGNGEKEGIEIKPNWESWKRRRRKGGEFSVGEERGTLRNGRRGERNPKEGIDLNGEGKKEKE